MTTLKPLASGAAITTLRREAAIYKPFGEQTEVLQATQVNQEQKGWIGQRYDADAGLQYLNARYYDPDYGFFLQPDWFEVTAAGVGTNRYSYSFNDPVNKMDPGGNRSREELGFFERVFQDAMEMASSAFSSTVLGGQDDRYAITDAMSQAGRDVSYYAGALDFAAGGAGGKTGRGLGNGLEWLAAKLGGKVAGGAKRVTTTYADAPATPPPVGVAATAESSVKLSDNVVAPYARPTAAGPTRAQTKSVQGEPCWECGAMSERQIADHYPSLAEMYYTTGSIDLSWARSLEAVRPHCFACSLAQGGRLSWMSRQFKTIIDGR